MTFIEGPYQDRTSTIVESPTGPVATVEPPLIVAPVPAPAAAPAPVATRRIRTEYASRFAPDAVITALNGLVALVMGLIAVTRGGFDGPMSLPVVKVLGFTHTTPLGMLEIAIGLGLLLSGATRWRTGEVFVGGVLGIAGFVGAVQTSSFHTRLALQSSLAWLAVIAGAVVVLSALLLPRFAKRSIATTQTVK